MIAVAEADNKKTTLIVGFIIVLVTKIQLFVRFVQLFGFTMGL